MRVTVLIPTWNRRSLLEKLLKQLPLQTHPIQEILVVDNGSEDDAGDAARQHGARVIRLDRNYGFSVAVNRGLREVRSDLVAVLNNDVELQPDWLARLVSALSSPDVWFACGKLLRASEPAVIDGTFDLLSRAGCAWRTGSGRPDGDPWNTERRVHFTPFTAALFRRELFDMVGVLDEKFESYLEDVDFGLRCALGGYSGLYVPEARAVHEGSATLGVWHRDTVRLIARNQVLLLAKHFPRSLLLRYAWPVLVGQLLWGFVASRHGGLVPYLIGKVQGLRSWRQVRDSAGLSPSPAGDCRNGVPLHRVLEASEREIRDLQEPAGYDLYWRVYFALT